jgi:inner membrane transporter RhtA
MSIRFSGIALMTGSAASSQLGAATAALAFPALGPAGVVAVRQWVAGIVLLVTVRPKFASFTRQQWRPVVALALIFAVMNLSLYTAIDRIGLGLAVTLEFLGPLSVALLASRRVTDLACALIAGAAVVVLARPQPSTDYAGILLALLAAACWAGYVLVNRVVGARLPGAQGPAAAASLSALLYIPIGIWALSSSQAVTGAALGRAATAGILCSAVPMIADLQALRRVPARFYGVFMSVNPVFAALTGLLVLGQSLPPADWLAIAVIVSVNAVSASGAGPGSVGQRSREAEDGQRTVVGEAGHDADLVAREGEHEYPVGVGDRGARVADVEGERGLAVGPGRHQTRGATGAERGRGPELGR